MNRPFARGRRALVSLTAVSGILAGTAVALPASPAAAAGDCAVAYPVDQLAAGQAVTGLTVTQGTQPEQFTGQVLGVLDDGIAPGVPMVMVQLSSQEIDQVGIWQGMSGSPVYASDGRLIGAVAYSLAMGSSPVAGVTPYEDMDQYMGGSVAPADGTVEVGPTAAREIAQRTDVSASQAEAGFEPLPMPLAVAGVGAQRLAAAAARVGHHSYLPTSAYALGQASGDSVPGADSIVAGGNLAASISYGDVTMAGIGTVTSVCGDDVVGFGHPMEWLGNTTLALQPADTLYIQDDLVSGFKVANLGDPVGTITEDRGTGISGVLGTLPDTATVSTTVTSGDDTRTGVSHVALRTPDALASTTFYDLLANHGRVVDGPAVGTENATWTVTGTDRHGTPFTLSAGDRFTSRNDLTWRVGFEYGDLVYALSRMPGVTIDDVTVSTDLSPSTATYQLSKIEVRQAGQWVEASRRLPAVVRAGGKLAARVTFTGKGGPVTLPMQFTVPRRLQGGVALLEVAGGNEVRSRRAPSSLAHAQSWLDSLVRSDEVQARFTTKGGYYLAHMGGSSVIGIAGRVHAAVDEKQIIGQFDRVVKGAAVVPVVVR